MSEIELNICDRNNAIHGEVPGGTADAVIAALSAEPETIVELEAALDRFIKPTEGRRPLALFRDGLNREPGSGGIIIADIAARIVAAELSDWNLLAQGQMEYQDGSDSSGVWLPYRLPDDWLFSDSMLEYEARREERRAEFDLAPLDVRDVLYGPQMIEFLVCRCMAARDAGAQGGVAEIHADWLMTPRADLRDKTPRAVILEKMNFIDLDLQFRAIHWSALGEGPPPLGRDTFAYRFGGFGTHEWVVYYDLMRYLLNSCSEHAGKGQIEMAAERARLESLMRSWLDQPCDEYGRRVPSAIIETERRRIPMTLTAQQMIIDEDCPVCQMMADESAGLGPGFWHLDGSHMDDGFAFSSYPTLAEYEEDERRRQQFNEEFDRKLAAGETDWEDPDLEPF